MAAPGYTQDKVLLTLMAIGAIVLILLLRAGLFELLVTWIIVFFGILVAYTALRAMDTSRGL